MLKLLCSCGAPGTITGPFLVLCRECASAHDERCRCGNCPGCWVCHGQYWDKDAYDAHLAGSRPEAPLA